MFHKRSGDGGRLKNASTWAQNWMRKLEKENDKTQRMPFAPAHRSDKHDVLTAT